MSIFRHCINGMIGAMLLVGIWNFLQTSPEATLLASPWNTSLLLTQSAPRPAVEQLRQIERTILIKHVVGPREDLYAIAKKYQVDQFTIRSSNGLDLPGALEPGTVLQIPNHRGTLYEVNTPEDINAISKGFAIGRRLGELYRKMVLLVNEFPLPDLASPNFPFKTGTLLFLPDAFKPTGLGIPFELHARYRVTSSYGLRKHPILGIRRAHRGMDLARPYGSPVVAARAGRVIFTGWMGGYGNMIEIHHVLKGKNGQPHGLVTCYGHLSKILVHVGQGVATGQTIGRVGSTGISTGPHLHFEVRDDSGRANNPTKYL